jgi:hypothetical protein
MPADPPIDEATIAMLGLKSTILTVCAGAGRVVLMRSTLEHQFVIRAVSTSPDTFDFLVCCATVGAQPDDASVFVCDFEGDSDALADAVLPHGMDHFTMDLTQLRPQLRMVAEDQFMETASPAIAQYGFKNPPLLSPGQTIMYERLGDNGYEILSAQSMFARTRAACRAVSQTVMEFRRKPHRGGAREKLAKLHLAWNIVMQAYVAIENVAAMYEALGATVNGDYKAFATTYLRFGHVGPAAQHTAHNTFQKLGSASAAKELARVLSIPIHRGHIKEYGLEGCGVDPNRLVAVGVNTLDILLHRIRRLGSLVVFSETEGTMLPYNPRKSAPKKAYDAVHHGFSHIFPVLAPYPQMISLHGGFIDEDAFAAEIHRRDLDGAMLTLDGATNRIERLVAPGRMEDVKPFVQAVFLATTMLTELTNYATDKFQSPRGIMPYFITRTGDGPQFDDAELTGLRERLAALRHT